MNYLANKSIFIVSILAVACATPRRARLSDEELIKIAFAAAQEARQRKDIPLEAYRRELSEQIRIKFTRIPYFPGEAGAIGGFDVFVDPYTGKVTDMVGRQ
jgi:hypothetical protein